VPLTPEGASPLTPHKIIQRLSPIKVESEETMNELTKFEKVFFVLLLALMIFTLGVQIGIHHGRTLERQEINYDYERSN